MANQLPQTQPQLQSQAQPAPQSRQSNVTTQTPFELDKLHVLIRDRIRVLFEGDAKALSSNNEKGPFDVLGEHTNFISLIKNDVTVHKMDGTTQVVKVPNGIMKIIKNDVHIYVGLTANAPGKAIITKPSPLPGK